MGHLHAHRGGGYVGRGPRDRKPHPRILSDEVTHESLNRQKTETAKGHLPEVSHLRQRASGAQRVRLLLLRVLPSNRYPPTHRHPDLWPAPRARVNHHPLWPRSAWPQSVVCFQPWTPRKQLPRQRSQPATETAPRQSPVGWLILNPPATNSPKLKSGRRNRSGKAHRKRSNHDRTNDHGRSPSRCPAPAMVL